MRLRRGEWLLLAATLVSYVAFAPVRWAIERQAGCEFTAPDMNFPPYNSAYEVAKTCLTDNDAAGLEAFVRLHSLGLDLAFPALLSAAITVLLVRIGEGLPRFSRMRTNAQWAFASILPMAYALADYAENWNVVRWLKSGDDALLPLISVLTTLKFAALAVAGVVAAAFLLSALKYKRLQ